MGRRKEKILFNVMLGAGLYLLDSLRGRLADNLDDINDKAHDRYGDLKDRARDRYGDLRDRAKDFYETASDRISRASDELTHDDHSVMNAAGAALLGAGVGFGLALLFAPASGEETRGHIAQTVRNRFSDAERKSATGTFGS
jgi:gas vesicle protein